MPDYTELVETLRTIEATNFIAREIIKTFLKEWCNATAGGDEIYEITTESDDMSMREYCLQKGNKHLLVRELLHAGNPVDMIQIKPQKVRIDRLPDLTVAYILWKLPTLCENALGIDYDHL